MHSVQESRSTIQQELISVQSEFASKSNQIENLKIELLGTSKTLEDEREKALQEKEEMKRQLEELEVKNLVLKKQDSDTVTYIVS